MKQSELQSHFCTFRATENDDLDVVIVDHHANVDGARTLCYHICATFTTPYLSL